MAFRLADHAAQKDGLKDAWAADAVAAMIQSHQAIHGGLGRVQADEDEEEEAVHQGSV